MIIEHYLEGIRYTLSNQGLKVGDEVFPILEGRITDDGKFIIHDIVFMSKDIKDFNVSGFPDDPHIIENLKYSSDKAYQIKTSHGFGPIEKYFKIIKKEKRSEEDKYEWEEIL